MPDPATPAPRRWFQLHLSTALLLMIAAGLFLLLNLQIRREVVMTGQGYNWEAYELHHAIGWPMTVYFIQYGSGVGQMGSIAKQEEEIKSKPEWMKVTDIFDEDIWEFMKNDKQGILWPGLAADFFIWLFCTTFIAVLCERAIRRRGTRKP